MNVIFGWSYANGRHIVNFSNRRVVALLIMPTPLFCATCRQIPASFFRHIKGHGQDVAYPYILPSDVFHKPVDAIKQSASTGCALCVVLASTIDAEWVPEQIRGKRRTRLRRGLIEPHQAQSDEDLEKALIGDMQTFFLCVGMDDVSQRSFFIVPEPWCILRSFTYPVSLMI